MEKADIAIAGEETVAPAKCAYSNITNVVYRLNADNSHNRSATKIDDAQLFDIMGICETTWGRWGGKGSKKTTRYPHKKVSRFYEYISINFPNDATVKRIKLDDFQLHPKEFTEIIDPKSLFLDAFSNICLEGVTRPEVQEMLSRRYGAKAYYIYSPTAYLNSNNLEHSKVVCDLVLVGGVDDIGLECFLFTINNFYRGGAYRPFRHEVINLIFARRDTVTKEKLSPNADDTQSGLSFVSRFYLLQDIGGEFGSTLPRNRLNGVCLATRASKPRPHSFPVIIETAGELGELVEAFPDISTAFEKRDYSRCYEVSKKLAAQKKIGHLSNDDPRAIEAIKNLRRYLREDGAPIIETAPGDTADEWGA